MEKDKVQITPDTIVRVRNEFQGSVAYDTGQHYRKWVNPGEISRVRVGELEEVYSRGVGQKLFNSRRLVIEDKEVEKHLGITPRDEDYDLYRDEIIELLTSEDMDKIEDVLMYCSDEVLSKIELMTIVEAENISTRVIYLVSEYVERDLNQIIEDMSPIVPEEDSVKEPISPRGKRGRAARVPRSKKGF